ncbi:MAG: phosphomethylpyrimidine synthase ThiC [Verrucomicrobiae bacterium]|nr:phosphomethylpyrimidine synthase ThiC [Verrucomicrobiae bacterium]
MAASIIATYDVSFSIGDGLRPGSIADANEAAFYGPKIDVQVWSVIGREFIHQPVF